MHKKWTLRVELTKKTSHCKSRDFLRKRRLKTAKPVMLLIVSSFQARLPGLNVTFEKDLCQQSR